MSICNQFRSWLFLLAVQLLLAGCLGSPSPREIPPPPPAAPAVAASTAIPVEMPAVAEPEADQVPAPADAPAARPAPPPEPLPEASIAPVPIAPEQSEGMQGIASYYAKRFNGRRTASGAVYDPNKLTAAHQALPFGTQVKVVNLANGREVTVTVNDRCRPRSFPFIDLSRAAAERLGFFGKGITKVRIIPMGRGEP